MKLLLKVIFFVIAVYCLPTDLFWQCGQNDSVSFLNYQLPNKNFWVKGNKSLIEGATYYQLLNDESIRLKSIVLSNNLYQESRTQSEKQIVEKIFNRKKGLFRVLGASDYKINSHKMIDNGKYKELNLIFQFFLKSKMSYSHEKYFIHPDQTLMVDLSWSSSSQEKQLEFAHSEFSKIYVTVIK